MSPSRCCNMAFRAAQLQPVLLYYTVVSCPIGAHACLLERSRWRYRHIGDSRRCGPFQVADSLAAGFALLAALRSALLAALLTGEELTWLHLAYRLLLVGGQPHLSGPRSTSSRPSRPCAWNCERVEAGEEVVAGEVRALEPQRRLDAPQRSRPSAPHSPLAEAKSLLSTEGPGLDESFMATKHASGWASEVRSIG